MDSGRFLLAVVLMIALVVVTNIMFPPVPPPDSVPADTIAATPVPVDSGPSAPRPAEPAPAPPDPLEPQPAATDTAAPLGVARAPADTILAESELYRYGVSTRGAALVRAELLRFESQTRPGPVELTPEDVPGLVRYRLRLGEQVVDLSALDFEPVVSDSARDVLQLAHDGATGGAPPIEFTYTFHPQEYAIDVRARVRAPAGITPQLLIDMGPTLRSNEANPNDDEQAHAYVFNHVRTGIQSTPLRSLDEELIHNGPLHWTTLKNKYFLASVIQGGESLPFGGLIARPLAENRAHLTTTLLANPDGELAFRIYAGPQEVERLAALGYDMRDVATFGWKFLQPILRPIGHAITWALIGMHRALGIGYGWVLILFGILVRIVLWPLNAKAMRSQLKNMEIQPRLKEIQTRYKNEPEKLQKEMLRLYREEGFNPMGGCLPMLIPFPILIALFFVFQSTIEFRGVSFLWLPDLSRADPYYILPVLLGASMFLLQWLSMRSTAEINPQMKFMMYFMPIFMTVLFLNFASGLNLYYASMNFASLPQQLQIMRERKRWHAARAPAPNTT